MSQRFKRGRQAFTLVELLVVIAIIGILIGMLLPAVQSVREAARRIQCTNQMRQMSLGMMNYESTNSHFPPGIKAKLNDNGGIDYGAPGLCWGAILLPFVEQNALYDQIGPLTDGFTDFGTYSSTTNWGVPGLDTELNGQFVANNVLSIFICPSDPSDEFQIRRAQGQMLHAKSNYVGVYGTRTLLSQQNSKLNGGNNNGPDPLGILYVNSKTTFGEITDGSSNTFIIGERDGAPIGTSPQGEELVRGSSVWCSTARAQWLDTCLGATDSDPNYNINTASVFHRRVQWRPFTSQHTGGATFGRADGSAQFVSESIDGDTYEAMGTRAGGVEEALGVVQ